MGQFRRALNNRTKPSKPTSPRDTASASSEKPAHVEKGGSSLTLSIEPKSCESNQGLNSAKRAMLLGKLHAGPTLTAVSDKDMKSHTAQVFQLYDAVSSPVTTRLRIGQTLFEAAARQLSMTSTIDSDDEKITSVLSQIQNS